MDEPLKALEELGAEFERVAHAVAAAPARRLRAGRRGRLLALAAPGLLIAAAAAMAATGLLTGAPVHNPHGTVFRATVGVGKPASTKLLALRVADPDGGPPWGMRTVTTTRGFGCVQVGRVVGGRLGVLGHDGAFGDDGLFHPLPANVLTLAYCQQPDAAGHVFIAVSQRGMPLSAADTGCVVAQPLPLPAGLPRRPIGPAQPVVPTCPAADVRVLYFGLLGPRATRVMYAGIGGRTVSMHVSRPTGAYLVVRRPSAGHPAQPQFSVGSSPGSGLLSVRYDGARRCTIVSAKRHGGARGCPLVGFVARHPVTVTAAQVRTPVRAAIGRHRVRPHTGDAPSGVRILPQWRITIHFRARHAGDARSNYVTLIEPLRHGRCSYLSIDPVDHDVAAGDIVRQIAYLPGDCRGTIHGTVSFRSQSASPMQLALAPAAPGGAVAGSFEVHIPN